jgi:hypothetical protein
VWWRTPLIPALGRQRQADLWVRGQPGLQSELQDSHATQRNPVSKKKKSESVRSLTLFLFKLFCLFFFNSGFCCFGQTEMKISFVVSWKQINKSSKFWWRTASGSALSSLNCGCIGCSCERLKIIFETLGDFKTPSLREGQLQPEAVVHWSINLLQRKVESSERG